MNTKILIIGQAPPAVKQTTPYDTTMLYEILDWVGITKEKAQDIFEFEAVYNKFPGRDPLIGNHLKPTQEQMELYWEQELEEKIQLADKVILLGNVAKNFINSKPKTWSCNTEFLELIHPSRLNYNRIIQDKENITQKLNFYMSKEKRTFQINKPIFFDEDEDDTPNTTNIKSFHYLEDGSIEFSILSTKKTTKKLTPGVYDICMEEENGRVVVKLKLNKLKENFNQDISYFFQDKINHIIKQFFNPEIKSKINTLGYNHKLGILLYGKAGTGKTSMFKKYFTQIVEENNGIIGNLINYGILYNL